MLKWAVNNPNRPIITENALLPDHNALRTRQYITRDRKRLRRKSSGNEMTNIRRKILSRDKENNLTSTPLPLHRQSLSPLRKFDSLRDLSNIPTTPDFLSTPVQTTKNVISTSTASKNNPSQYAATLPTFDAEYSPCSLVPGPVIALRGMGIADAYFEKPRYLANGTAHLQSKRLKLCDPPSPLPVSEEKPRFQMPSIRRTQSKRQTQCSIGDESLSSSRMGDTTLDRMIDAILESARKERRAPKQKQQSHPVMSPTYTRAEDPASDLNEIWPPDDDEKHRFNEREVRTPESLENSVICNTIVKKPDDITLTASCHLRRQRAVRRKRKHLPAQQEFSEQSYIKTPTDEIFANNSFLRKSFDELIEMATPKGYMNLSPDSGRNSASELEESSEDNNNCTRRRLSFSPNLPVPKFRDKDKIG